MANLLSNALIRRCAAFAFFAVLAAPVAHGQGAEAVTWARADTCPEIRAYIAQYPGGRYVGEARAALSAKNCPDPEAEARKRTEQLRRTEQDLREQLARSEAARIAAENKATSEARLRREAEERARTAATTTPQDAELNRLANLRGDWRIGYESTSTAPSFFRSGYFILGARTKTGGWDASGSNFCGGAIVRGNAWAPATADGSMSFELVYGRSPSSVTNTVQNFYSSRASYLGATWSDAWRALSEAAFAKGGISCGALQDRRYAAPAPAPTTATAPPSAPISSSTESELARLASSRGDWITGWLNSNAAPTTFRGGYYILGASSKTGGWFTGAGYPCGGAIVRGNTWYPPTANSTLTFELVYGRLPSGTTSTTHSYYHSRTTYLGATFQDAWRALSEAAYAKSGQSCGAVSDRRYVTPAPAANAPAATPAPTVANTESELARLAGQRGAWTAGYENSSSEPASFKGFFIVGADSGSGWMGQSSGFCGGAIVRGSRWYAPGPNGATTAEYVLAYGRKTATLTPEAAVGTYARRLTYLGATWNSAWVALSDSAYAKSAQSCGALQDRRYAAVPTAAAPATLSVRDQVQRDITGTWRRSSGPCSSPLNRFSFPNGQLNWSYTVNSTPSSFSSMSTSGWTITYENNQLLIVSGGSSRTTIGIEGSYLVWRSNGSIHCSMTRESTP